VQVSVWPPSGNVGVAGEKKLAKVSLISECTNVLEQFRQRRTQRAITALLTTGYVPLESEGMPMVLYAVYPKLLDFTPNRFLSSLKSINQIKTGLGLRWGSLTPPAFSIRETRGS
jgi:hypothetical protein